MTAPTADAPTCPRCEQYARDLRRLRGALTAIDATLYTVSDDLLSPSDRRPAGGDES